MSARLNMDSSKFRAKPEDVAMRNHTGRDDGYIDITTSHHLKGIEGVLTTDLKSDLKKKKSKKLIFRCPPSPSGQNNGTMVEEQTFPKNQCGQS